MRQSMVVGMETVAAEEKQIEKMEVAELKMMMCVGRSII